MDQPPPEPHKPNPLRRWFTESLKRSDVAAVLPAYQFLFQPARYKVGYGGRGAGRSWNFGRGLILRAHERKTRILCGREIQSSITESVHRLLSDQIELLNLSEFFEIQTYSIAARNGSEFIFEGLRSNVSKIKSLEGVDVVWVEEAENISEDTWSKLIPTIRKRGSEIWVTFNPFLASDPTYRRFVTSPPPKAIVRKTTYLDNPHFPPELEDERVYLQSVDDDAYRWIWEGECRTVSDALILKNKFAVEPFDVQPTWSGPHHGLDFGFSRDPNAAVQLYIDDVEKVLYVRAEYWGLGVDIDALPEQLEAAIPGISAHVLFCDCARPESISYLQRHGVARATAADKWSGSVNDGLAYLRSFRKIIIHPTCKRFLEEARNYCFKVDRLTGVPMPEPEDRWNHLIDSARYALSPMIRNLPSSGFFNRAALLVKGQPAQIPPASLVVYAVLSASPRAGTAVGFAIFAASPFDVEPRLIVCDWDLMEAEEALSVPWLEAARERLQLIAREYRSLSDSYPQIHVEHNDFGMAAFQIAEEHAASQSHYGSMININLIDRGRGAPVPSIDDTAAAIRSTVNSGAQPVKLSRLALERQVTNRAATTNHLLAQIVSYQAGAKEMPQELLSAFCTGVQLWKDPR
jgi:phage terminase large subunit